MNRFLKLVHFEVSRFILVFSVMLGAIVGIQISAAILEAKSYVNGVNSILKEEKITYAKYAEQHGMFDAGYYLGGIGFLMPLMFGIAVLVLYVFFIWYRDWFGKATFSYRLLMLPTNRINVYVAKLVTILLFIFTALSIQLGTIYIIFKLFDVMIPKEIYDVIPFREIAMNDMLFIIMPTTFGNFAFNYLVGIAAVTVVFTCILFERSYRLKGIVYAILFGLLCVVIIVLPVVYDGVTSMLYISELYLSVTVCAIVIIVLSLVTSNHLLKNKINV